MTEPQQEQRGHGGASAALPKGFASHWSRLPAPVRTGAPLLVVLALAIIYPFVVETLKGIDPIGDFFPAISSVVIILVFTMMAVGLNIVVGYSGLLDLGYVAFYAVGAYMAGWFASGHFEQIKVHFGAASVPETANGIHVSVWLVLILAGICTAIAGVLI
jgi:branched-chain amino acid transport system permease protein